MGRILFLQFSIAILKCLECFILVGLERAEGARASLPPSDFPETTAQCNNPDALELHEREGLLDDRPSFDDVYKLSWESREKLGRDPQTDYEGHEIVCFGCERGSGEDGTPAQEDTTKSVGAPQRTSTPDCKDALGDKIDSCADTHGIFRRSDEKGSMKEAETPGRISNPIGAAGVPQEEPRTRDGWRVGEGIAVPAEGVNSIWHVLKTRFDDRLGFASPGESSGHRRPLRTRSVRESSSRIDRKSLARDVSDAAEELRQRREAVVDAIRWAWKGYVTHAWGTDELMPLTRRGKDSFGLGLTIVDSMDTLWLAMETEEFMRCVDWVSQEMDVTRYKNVNVFETTIRVLGGLLSSYHLSGEEVLLEKAEELGRGLAKAFMSPSGVPFSDVNLSSGRAFNPSSSWSSLSEATTLQLEFSYLSALVGDTSLHRAAQGASEAIEAARFRLGWGGSEKDGLAPVYVSPETGLFENLGRMRVTLGARGDSYYEYLLKQWLLSGKRETRYLERYQGAIRGVEGSLLAESSQEGWTFVGELDRDDFVPKMDHLVCFLPGTLALGYHTGAGGDAGERHLEVARRLMETCYEMYARTETGLAPEIVHFNVEGVERRGHEDIYIKPNDRHNILRPEALESLYYLYWITGEEGFRDQAWFIFQSFEKHCRVDRGGYAGLEDVTDVQSIRRDKMETFFVSESLKYLLLIFSNENPLPFDRYVINTEAHPFPV